MDKPIQYDRQVDVPVVVHMSIQPVEEEDGDVVIDVEETQLSPLLANDYENGIPEIPDLADVKQPQQISQGWVSLAVPNARQDRVSVAVRQQESLQRHVRAKHDLADVVNELDRVRVHRRDTKLHDRRSNHDEEEVRQRDVERCREVR